MMLYFDNAATTVPEADVLNSYMKVNQKFFYNPNSPHAKGIEAARLLDEARAQIKQSLQLNDETILFTSGATESNNMALKGAAYQKRPFGKIIITSVLEHPSVLEVMRQLEVEGFTLKYVNVTKQGQIDLAHLKSLLDSDVILVTCMQVNNIMGQTQPIQDIGQLLADYPKVHFHVDAVQALGKQPISMSGIDSLAISGHKFNGLKGQGLLILKNAHALQPTIHGGGQELGLRSGTVNLPNNVALAKAVRLAINNQEQLVAHLNHINHSIRTRLENYPGIVVNSPKNASPHILNISFPGVRGEVLVNAFSKRDVMISTTSACSSKHAKINEVLNAMQIDKTNILGSIRLSFDHHTTNEDVTLFFEKLKEVYQEVEELLRK